MKKLIFLSAFIVLTSLLGSQAFAQADSAKVVSVEKFDKMKSKKKNVLLDIRTPEEIAEGQIAGAGNIDFLDESFSQKIEQLDKSKTYLLYCRTGKRTAKAGAAMKAAGFKKVYMLDGGLTAWQEQGKPIKND
ncbi:MAG: rhodanese-like domain-containing protein [Bacteroidota bacterium]|uniref:Rhodanese-related sulfurtransferase n=1 Tax=Algoriphagus faecimaris TaxID=686796 RepID=A0A1G6URS8_9BACT|nr:rhodanese-like domain-containing protein [Algoriphagus faecimaris]SDD43983.1 Rhodanese-related sulfurtransferase [Algoriphagus faecimaris]